MNRHRLAWVQRIAAAAIVVFWITFWADHDGFPPDVLDYESNFIIPDLGKV